MKLPLLSGRHVLAALQRLGFARIQGKGSHVKGGIIALKLNT
jgi:predicted RNA binding protein YcfA (HicA-like mRNA interferase family)